MVLPDLLAPANDEEMIFDLGKCRDFQSVLLSSGKIDFDFIISFMVNLNTRRTIFAKGNLDVRDSLIALRLGGQVSWNGINELLRQAGSELRVRVHHETWTRSDALLTATGHVPTSLLTWSELPWGSYPLASQFSRAFLEVPADAYVMSAMPDIFTQLYRHRQEGYCLHPEGRAHWPQAARDWLARDFERLGLLAPEASMEQLHLLVTQLRARTDAPILIYNVSSVMPSELIHCWEGLQETFSTRVMRFNMALTELSRASGISIVDVDRIVALMGAQAAKRDQIHLTAAGCEAVAREVVRILVDLDVLVSPST